MTIHVKVGEAKTRLSELLKLVEQGEEVIIFRGNEEVAVLSASQRKKNHAEAVRQLKEIRKSFTGLKGITVEEAIAWKNEGRK